MAQPIRIRARVHEGTVEVMILMPHPMETGMRQDEAGRTVPAHFITDMSVTLDERPVFSARMSFAVARDPLLTFRVRDAQSGQRLRVTWTDSLGESRVDTAIVT